MTSRKIIYTSEKRRNAIIKGEFMDYNGHTRNNLFNSCANPLQKKQMYFS